MLKMMERLLLILMVMLLAGCATTHYGVTKESWQIMSEADRAEARRQHNERRTAEAHARAAREERLRVEREAELMQLEAELDERRQRAALIYRGELGRPGDLVRVTIRDGVMSLRGHHRSYRTTEFLIATGDVKRVPILFDDRRASGQTLDLHVSYLNGRLWIDTDQFGRKTEQALQLIYQDSWHDAQVFVGLRSRGALELSRVTVEVEAVDVHHRHRTVASRRPGQKVVVEKKVVNKTTVVNKVDMRVKNKTVNNNQTHITNVNRVNNKIRVNNTNVTNNNQKIVKNRNKTVTKNKPLTNVTRVVHNNHETQVVDDAHNKRRGKASRKKQAKKGHEKSEKDDDRDDDEDKTKNDEDRNYSKIEVKVRGGMIRRGSKNVKIKPESYDLAYGETRAIKLKTKSDDQVKIWVRCKPGALLISEDGSFGKQSQRLGWKPDWKNGKAYKIKFKDSSRWKEMKVTIKAEA